MMGTNQNCWRGKNHSSRFTTFYANTDQSHNWADDHVAVLKQKSLGQAIMVSDFIEEATANYLRHDGKEAQLLLETP